MNTEVTKPPREAFAEFVSARRNSEGWARDLVARRAREAGFEISASYIQKIEEGHVDPSVVSTGKLDALAVGLRITRASLDAAMSEWTGALKHNNDARLRQLHELPILNNSLGIMSDDGSVIPITNGSASGNHGAGELRPAEFVLLPLYGPAACGSPPSWSFDDTEERYPVPRIAIEHTRASAVFKVSGDSMEAERIRDGDFVMVRPYSGEAPRHGDIVIVESEGGYVCKMYRKSLLGAYLESRYADRDPEIWKPADEARPVGLVVGVVNMNLYGGRR